MPPAAGGNAEPPDSSTRVIASFALRLSPYLFVRPGELVSAEWSEFDFEAAE